MAFNRLFADDEELGKKDDDFRPLASSSQNFSDFSASSPSWLSGPRSRRRRLVIIVVAIAIIFLFLHNMPKPLGPVGDRVDVRDPSRTIRGAPVRQGQRVMDGEFGASKQPVREDKAQQRPEKHSVSPPLPSSTLNVKMEDVPPALRGAKQTAEHFYNGPLKFYRLPTSLRAISHTGGKREDNKNVLFVAASLESASRLVPVACEMARYGRNHVHFALVGRGNIELDELRSANGATTGCDVYWHDARPDEADRSTNARMEYGVMSALYHIQQFIHPQAYIVDELEKEDAYFAKEVRAHAERLSKSIIELPEDATERMMWVTMLDHLSLAAWNSVDVDILIHVPPGTSGSLIRLLRSLEAADYFGSRIPHITIELPPTIEAATQRFLDTFIWPPRFRNGREHDSKISLKRRISTSHLTPLEASVRTVESFYSARPLQSHVLLLSTQAELSPLYYHYLFYNILEYAYGYYSRGTYSQLHLTGIALDLPSVKLDGTVFNPPSPKDAEHANENSPKETPFLWQVPDTNAALYFGHKWQELHNYLSHRLATHEAGPSKKLVSTALPAFAEPLLELMRARNDFLLFPHLPDGNGLATIHNELAVIPEEFETKSIDTAHLAPATPTTDTLYLGSADAVVPLLNSERPLLSTPLVRLLAQGADLPELHTLPIVSWDGTPVKHEDAVEQANTYKIYARQTFGNCAASQAPTNRLSLYTADDLFCTASDAGSAAAADVEALVPAHLAVLEQVASKDEAFAAPTKTHTPVNFDHTSILLSSPERTKEAPNPATPGEVGKGASIEEIAEFEKAKIRSKMTSGDSRNAAAHLPQGKSQGSTTPSSAELGSPVLPMSEVMEPSDQEREAMLTEFDKHLGRQGQNKDKSSGQTHNAAKEQAVENLVNENIERAVKEQQKLEQEREMAKLTHG